MPGHVSLRISGVGGDEIADVLPEPCTLNLTSYTLNPPPPFGVWTEGVQGVTAKQ